jgi:hypothetical protein
MQETDDTIYQVRLRIGCAALLYLFDLIKKLFLISTEQLHHHLPASYYTNMLHIIPPLALTALTLQLTTTYEQRYQFYTKAVASRERFLRAAKFSLTIASIIRSYKCKSIELFFRNVVSCNNHLTEEEEKLTWSKQHAQGADTLSKTIMAMQGFYVK